MTRLTHIKEESSSAILHSETVDASNAAEQILHLKRLLVTLKQQYENGLQALRDQLVNEQNQKLAIQQELERSTRCIQELQQDHNEELSALREQQITLRNLLQQTQEELKLQGDHPISDVANRQRVEQLERVIPYLRERTEEANLETEQLRDELEKSRQKVKDTEEHALRDKQEAQKEIEQLKQMISRQELAEQQTELIASHTSSYQLRQELEEIKRTLIQGHQETKALEARYIDILNEKVSLEHQFKQLCLQSEHQSSNLAAFQEQIHELDRLNKEIEAALQVKENQLSESEKCYADLKERALYLEEAYQEKQQIQDSYEQLKEEWCKLTENLDEAIDSRIQAEQQVIQLDGIIKEQDHQLAEKGDQCLLLMQEKAVAEAHIQELRSLLDESESRLKVAQQHLAKKVKEAAILTEKVESQQTNLDDALQGSEALKNQINQLQANMDIYQKQEKRLQDQLHEALKGTESQVTKWEEKYFRMYDKWQESENRIRELKKFEEKHHQMQSLLANLGSFMGGSSSAQSGLFHSMQELVDKSTINRAGVFEPVAESVPLGESKTLDEKCDLFGMKLEKFKPNLFS